MLSGRRVLVTGATGRLGTELCRRVEELGGEPVPLVLEGYPPRPKSGAWSARTPPRVVRGAADLDGLPVPEAVVHLHWKVDRSRPFAEQVENEVRWNVTGLGFLWDWLRKHPLRALVNVSSIRVFGAANPNPIHADDPPRPDTPYGAAKLLGEVFLDANFGEPTGVSHLRLGSVCSPAEHPSQLMSRLATSLVEGTRITVNAGHVVNLLDIEEAVDRILVAALRPARGRYLLVAPPRPVEEIARLVEKLAGTPLQADFTDLAPGVPDPEFVSDLEKLTGDWVRQVPLETSAERILTARRAARGNPG